MTVPKKSTTRGSSTKAIFLYQSKRDRMDAIEAEAEKRDISARAMLDKIVDDWFGGQIPEPKKKKKSPWYLE